MAIVRRLLYFLIIVIAGIKSGFSQEYRQSIDMRIPFIPGTVMINGKPTVYYELQLTNFSNDSISLEKMEVLNVVDSTVVVSFSKDDLINRLSRLGLQLNDKENIIAPGNSRVVYLEWQNDTSNAQLIHRLGFALSQGNKKVPFSVQGAPIRLSEKPPVVLGAPLNGGPWVAVYDPSWSRGHRRVIYTVGGKARIPGRFAIDFIKLDKLGHYANGDNDVVKNWYGYGAAVLAVSDGVISTTRDDFRESNTLSNHPAHPAEKATGNYIAMDIGNNCIAFYEHLQPGSIKVVPGQRVKKGDVIAAVGFTGQTTGPHLHFHVADQHSALGAEGIPFVFERFTVLGRYVDFSRFGKDRWMPVKDAAPLMITAERPESNSVIKFDVGDN
ncbi:M23 family metallopeptidase [Chitinophaga qingshengii]|uniref:M23 family metallopeptidase n=1 Tax=Chitinophaga qingshengii TaxID=1569794 RepID=A0ABR7TGZ2_9BACT|nr:M23 family metallopeptidase [Chitinophaga qingshengii]MBC9929751.1 M23 family metallopeptidase [Chitinophaga qingshengii]